MASKRETLLSDRAYSTRIELFHRMSAYIIRRLLFMIPTLLGIMLVSFVVVQFAPGGPVERVIAQLSGADTGASSRIPGSGQGGDFGGRGAQGGSSVDSTTSKYRGAQGLDPEFIKKLEKQFGFDKPAYERFFLMLKNFIVFDFGKSYFRDTSVMQLIKEKLPVSMSLGIWMTLLTYLISIPLGIRKAVSRRLALRHLDLGHHHHRLRHPGLPDRDLPDHPVRRRLLLGCVPAARTDLRQLGGAVLVAEDPRLFLASDAADHRHDALRLRHHDAADQELVPRRDQEAVRADRAGQGLHAAPDALRAHLPQRDADRHRRISRAPSCTRSSPARC